MRKDRAGRLRTRCMLFLLGAAATTATAVDRRDIVFDCPCSAEWVAGDPDGGGTLTFNGGVRSYRATESGEVWLSNTWWRATGGAFAGRLAGRDDRQGRWTVEFAEPERDEVIEVHLLEQTARDPDGTAQWRHHEKLALWPVPSEDTDGPRRYIDILTDSDGDGVGDVNERLAGTAWDDPESNPGSSDIDVLVLYTTAFREAESGYPYTRILHVLSVAAALFEDSGTNIRLRTVGMAEVGLGENGWAEEEARSLLMASHGADVSIQFSPTGPALSGGLAQVGASLTTRWSDAQAWDQGGSVLITPHELGHVMGLAHSARQAEASGAWRWSRGHHVTPPGVISRQGTIMASGPKVLGGVFSDPGADCGNGPCGVSAGELDGADSVSTLNVLRFQVAAHRPPASDADDDGFVDAADAAPDDPDDWFDVDGDGVADNADPDDDNDGTPDIADAFPLDPDEWADADLDGIGDNEDDQVTDLSPFRDPGLRTAVETALGKESGAPITATDMASLTVLQAGHMNIRDLTGLEQATGLESLQLTGNRLIELAPLAGLVELSRLDLNDNMVADVSPLSGLEALTSLSLSDNPVADISPLSGLSRCVDLRLDNTGVNYADVTALPYFDRLRGLGLGGLGIEDVSRLANLPLWVLDLRGNPLADLTPLSQLTALQVLNLVDTGTTVIDALAGLKRLTWLGLSENRIMDVTPLSAMSGLNTLLLAGNDVADIGPLAGMAKLKRLDLDRNDVFDIGSLEGAVELATLLLRDNSISDVAPLSAMTQLTWLDLSGNEVSDVAPLSDMTQLTWLDLSGNEVSDVSPLSRMTELRWLTLNDNHVSEMGPLAAAVNLEWLHLRGNRISDVSPLSAMTRLRWLFLNRNSIADIGPLVDRSIFGGPASTGAHVNLNLNPLDDTSLEDHIPTLRGWGIGVGFTRRGGGSPSPFADPTLRALVADAVAGFSVHVDDPSLVWPIDGLEELRLYGRGITSLMGLQAAEGLKALFAASNRITQLGPLADLLHLNRLDLQNNRISDVSPLVSNSGISAGDWIVLDGNPLSQESLNNHVPALLARSVAVSVGTIAVAVAVGDDPLSYDISGYLEAVLGEASDVSVSVDDEAMATAEFADGSLVITPAAEGRTTLIVTASNGDGERETLEFALTVRGGWVVPLLPSASDLMRQGFVRVVNHDARSGAVGIVAIDDTGTRKDPVALAVGPRQAVHFNSDDLEAGNPEKGLTGYVGSGTGDWRLEVRSALDLEVLSFIRTPDGFLTAMHDSVTAKENVHRVPIFNPASNVNQASMLRLINLGPDTLEPEITGIDDRGQTPGSLVRVEVPAGAAVLLRATELEAGGPGLDGMLGDGVGKWRLRVTSEGDLLVLNLLESPEGHLTNLSTGGFMPFGKREIASINLFPSASDPLGRQGFLRVINRSDADGIVNIQPHDDTGRRYEPLTLALGAGEAGHFNSDDLELGNPGKGMSGSTGPGTGDWRLAVSSELEIQVLAYVRTPSGFLTSMHDLVPQTGRKYHVAMFNPGHNAKQVSTLRIVNRGSRPARVSIAGVDDGSGSPGDVVRVTVPAGAAFAPQASHLETGCCGLRGMIGDGTGKWRLLVDSEQPLFVMNLLASPTGHLTNLSTSLAE